MVSLVNVCLFTNVASSDASSRPASSEAEIVSSSSRKIEREREKKKKRTID